MRAFPNSKAHPAGFGATTQVTRLVLSSTVIRKKRHESVMSIVIYGFDRTFFVIIGIRLAVTISVILYDNKGFEKTEGQKDYTCAFCRGWDMGNMQTRLTLTKA